MYHAPGEYVTDFCIIRSAGTFHLFHIRGERWTWPLGYREIDLGHAISTDLCTWTPVQPVLGPGAPGAWDETGIWAPDIIEVDGVYYMFYTGSDAQNNQAIGLASSADLRQWDKHLSNPVITPGAWSDRAVGHDVAGRDGMVYADKERRRYLMYYTATLADGRACIALAQSADLHQWEDLGPTYIEDNRGYNRCESPYLVRHDDSYYLFYSAKGGAGGSTVAHNVAWAISQSLRQDVLILDMDLAFGTAGLNFNQDPPHGIADALGASGKVDPTMLDRLMSKAANHINLLTAPAMLDKTFDYGERDFEQVLELAQKTTPVVVLDIPHTWTAWVRHTLATIDEIVIVAEPDLANLRNAKNLADTIKALRPNEAEPLLVINKLGIPKRPEIAPKEFAASVECKLLGQVGFDPATFGTAANNGQMLAEVAANNRANDVFRMIGMHVTGRSAPEAAGKSGNLKLSSFLKLKKA